MMEFSFVNPTKIIFGQGQIATIQQEIPSSAKVMIIYGGGSIKQNGIYQQVVDALSEHQVVEFSGIEPNPSYETAMRAVAQIKEHNIDYLLAVGGGSVIDGTKFIAAAAKFDGKPWDILAKAAEVTDALPIGVVLTLPATGSESNSYSVVSKLDSNDKLPFFSEKVQPKFAVLDAQVTKTLPERQLANGIVDAFVHVMEQYLTFDHGAKVQDRFAEGLLHTLIEEGPRVFAEPDNMEVRENLMWSATMALNGLIGAGVPQDWSTHMLGHEITALYGLDHAQTLAIVLPRMMHAMRQQKEAKLLQYAERIWGISEQDNNIAIDLAIEKTVAFFHSVNMPTRFSDYQLGEEIVDAIVEQLERHGMVALGENQQVTLDISREVLKASL
ncbi:iron-containing alcohol dehydrogenase [Pseudoalteromonas piratica]|uniref:Aldehyde reductase n=1 Tax=Pseudoalteromonas piratica TaxID=1348114 RepID=A0A0A7ECA4_9GAMM|nr:iron-containing alcohol dehydrogenase [Pseudoalteromonas piratica]AIY64219.1 aldehyde reductase [Pseudoalteromonas piratica]